MLRFLAYFPIGKAPTMHSTSRIALSFSLQGGLPDRCRPLRAGLLFCEMECLHHTAFACPAGVLRAVCEASAADVVLRAGHGHAARQLCQQAHRHDHAAHPGSRLPAVQLRCGLCTCLFCMWPVLAFRNFVVPQIGCTELRLGRTGAMLAFDLVVRRFYRTATMPATGLLPCSCVPPTASM